MSPYDQSQLSPPVPARSRSRAMSYLKVPRTKLILAFFVVSSVFLALFPALDLQISSFFFDGRGFHLAASWWVVVLHKSVACVICAALVTLVGMYWFNRRRGRNVWGVDGKVLGFAALVLILGAGLVVNVVLKDAFDRARPRNLVQFGGVQRFTPLFVVSSECSVNCSLSSGDTSGAFFPFALALALSRRRTPIVLAALYCALVSFSRIASGAHFFSDTVVSFFVMWITTDALHHFILLPFDRVRSDRPEQPVGIPGVGFGTLPDLTVDG